MRTAAALLCMLPVLAAPAVICAASRAGASEEPRAEASETAIQGEVAIDAYLSLLAQVAPAARDGAEAFMTAFRSRCGRPLQAIELRRAFAGGTGDSALMAMVRASHRKDMAAVQRLGATIACPGS